MQFNIRLVALAAAFVAVSSAHAAVSIDANIENDTTYKAPQDTSSTTSNKSSTANGGRVEINFNAELLKSGDNFVNARTSLIMPTGSGSAGVDDAWIQLGNSAADLKVGRYESVDMFPLGKDTLVVPAVTAGYRGNTLRGRTATGQLQATGGYNASSSLRFALDVVSGADGYTYGVRPSVSYTAGALVLRAAGESLRQDAYTSTGTGTANVVAADGSTVVVTTQTTTNNAASSTQGYGLTATYKLSSSSLINASYAQNTDTDSKSFGLNAVFGDFGIGAIQDKTGDTSSNTFYAAYSFPLLGVKGASITPALSVSDGTGVGNLNAMRVRLNYAF